MLEVAPATDRTTENRRAPDQSVGNKNIHLVEAWRLGSGVSDQQEFDRRRSRSRFLCRNRFRRGWERPGRWVVPRLIGVATATPFWTVNTRFERLFVLCVDANGISGGESGGIFATAPGAIATMSTCAVSEPMVTVSVCLAWFRRA